MSENDIIEGCKKGDRKAQEMLFREHYVFAMRIALRYSRDEQDAADITSHSFYKIFRSIKSYDNNKGIFTAWMHRIVINEGLSHIAKRNKFQFEEINDFTEAPPIDIISKDGADAETILALVRQLPPATHAVFMLYAAEGYKHKEIAQLLSISEGTSKWHLSEARRILQSQLSTYFNKQQ